MTNLTYQIDDAHGNQITAGLGENEAERVAQGIANRRGEPVYLWAPDADAALEIAPRALSMDTTNIPSSAPVLRWSRTDTDGASEILTLVTVTDGALAGVDLVCADLDSKAYPYLVQVTTGPDVGDNFVGLYDLDGDRLDSAGLQWEAVTEAPAEVIEQIARGWESGMSTVAALFSALTTAEAADTIVSYRGHQLRRRTRGSEVLWQSADADPTWGYWYSTARQAAAESNASDRVARRAPHARIN